MSRTQTLDERQREALSTCLASCRNIAYPSLGAVEELAEYWQKLKYAILWNPDIKPSEQSHLQFLIDGFISVGLALGKYAKMYRHSSTEEHPEGFVPFTIKTPEDYMFPSLGEERLLELQKEVGDIKWMLEAIDFYTHHPAGTDPTDPSIPMNAQTTADINHDKLESRRASNTIDAKGDNTRTPV